MQVNTPSFKTTVFHLA